MSTNPLSTKVIIVAIVAIGAIAAILVAPSIAQATARQQQKIMWSGEGIPQINGSVSVANETSYLISENIKVSFVAAAETAQGQAAARKLLGGHLGVVQGYLVYNFFVVNTANQTGYLTVIDAGNGEVLYTTEPQPLDSFGHGYGKWGGNWHGGWHGPWKWHGFGGGMWS